jgi:ABC-type molybdate transport system substrate-binding protein
VLQKEAVVGRRLRRTGLAVAACLIVTVAAACSSGSSTSGSASPAASGAQGTLIVFGAGTLATPFADEIARSRRPILA